MKHKIFKIIALIGMGLFLFLLVRTGPREILVTLKELSLVHILILFALRFLYFALRSLNWKTVLAAYQERISFTVLLRARLAGYAVGNVTPAAKIGGEVVRALMIGGENKKRIMASVVVDKTVELLSTACLVTIGILTALATVSMEGYQRLVFLFLSALLISAVVFVYRKQKKGLFLWLIDGLKKVKLNFKFIEKRRDSLTETDSLISRFYVEHKSDFLLVCFLYGLLYALWVMEIYLTLVFVGTPDISLLTGFLLVSIGNFANLVPALPAGLGLYELTYVSVFVLLGVPIQMGLAVILIRRGLSFFWTGIGLIPMLKNSYAQALRD
jgi:uncharacterized protein (TIRG00374 family)